jgi:hypothetical protein
MPTKHSIPSRVENHCEPCEFHKCIGALYVRVGPGGWKEYSCSHPGAFDDPDEKPLADAGKEQIRQRLIGSMLKEGRHIGKTEQQPSWCPLKRSSQDSETTNGHG